MRAAAETILAIARDPHISSMSSSSVKAHPLPGRSWCGRRSRRSARSARSARAACRRRRIRRARRKAARAGSRPATEWNSAADSTVCVAFLSHVAELPNELGRRLRIGPHVFRREQGGDRDDVRLRRQPLAGRARAHRRSAPHGAAAAASSAHPAERRGTSRAAPPPAKSTPSRSRASACRVQPAAQADEALD